MKVLFVVNNFPPLVDGVGDYTFNLCNQFSNHGHDVYVICSQKDQVEDFVKQCSHFTVFPVIKRWGWDAISQVITLASKISPDWLLIQYEPYSFNYYGVPFWFYGLVQKLAKQKYQLAVTFHEIFIPYQELIAIGKPKVWPIALSQRLITYTAAYWVKKIIVSNRMVQNQLRPFAAKIHRIPVGSNVIPYQVTPLQIADIKKAIAPKGEFILCTFGIRNHALLTEVLAKLLADGYAVKLLILGNLPSDKESLLMHQVKKLNLENHIVKPGYLNNEDLYLYLKAANSFILMEHDRGGVTTKSGSLAAAYAAGLPIIGTRGYRTDDFFTDNANIMLLNYTKPEDVVAAVKKLIEHPEISKKLSAGATATYQHFLSWEKIFEQYAQLLQE